MSFSLSWKSLFRLQTLIIFRIPTQTARTEAKKQKKKEKTILSLLIKGTVPSIYHQYQIQISKQPLKSQYTAVNQADTGMSSIFRFTYLDSQLHHSRPRRWATHHTANLKGCTEWYHSDTQTALGCSGALGKKNKVVLCLKCYLLLQVLRVLIIHHVTYHWMLMDKTSG